jgi:fibronectin-binding autotransporter adhesin
MGIPPMNTFRDPFYPLRVQLVIIFLLGSAFAGAAFGQYIWTGTVSGEWTDSANWTPAGVPGSFESILFNSSGGGHITLDLPVSPVTVKNIEFDTAACASYLIGTPGEQLHLNGPEYGHGAITLDGDVTQAQTVAADLTLNGDTSLYGVYNFVNNSSAPLNITGAIAPSGGKTYYLSLMGSGSGLNTLSGLMNNGDTMVQMQVNVLGGTWALTGLNTFGGGVVIQGGTLVANTMADGGQSSSIGNSASTDTNLSFEGTGSTLRYTGQATSTNRNFWITDGMTATFDIAGESLTFTGGVTTSCSGALVKTGSGTLTLNGTSHYSGATTLQEGVLQANSITNSGHDSSIGKASAAASNLLFDGGTLEYTGGTTTTDRSFSITAGKVAVISIANPGTQLTMNAAELVPSTTGGFTKAGPGTLMFYGTPNYTGLTTVAEGTLAAVPNQAFGRSSGIYIAAGATLDLSIGNNTIGPLSGEAGSRFLIYQTGIASSTDATFGGVISGSSGLVKTTPSPWSPGGMQTLTGSNTYTGTTVITTAAYASAPLDQPGGITLSGADGSITSSSAISISGGAALAVQNFGSAVNSNRIGDTATVTMAGGTLSFATDSSALSVSETIGALMATGGYNTISNGQSVSGTATLTFASLTRTGGAVVNFAGQWLGFSPKNRIRFTVAPTLGDWALYNGVGYAAYDELNGIVEADYADVTRLSSGSKIIYSASEGNIRVIDGTGAVGNIELGSTETEVLTLTQAATGGPVTIDTAGNTLGVGSILMGTGAGGLTIGTGVNSGNLTSAPDTDRVTFVNNASTDLIVNSTVVDYQLTGEPFSIGLAVVGDGSGNTTLLGTNTYTGVTTLWQGVLNISTLGNGGTAGNLGAASNEAANIVFSGGTLHYTGNDTSTDRGFTVTADGSRLDTDANLDFAGTGINLSSGSLTIGGLGNTTITSVLFGAGALHKDGSSILTLQGMNTFTGGVTIRGGVVCVTSIGNGGQAGNLGAASNASANLVLDGGTLVYNSSGIVGSNRGMTITANGGTFVNANANATLFLANGSPVAIAPSGVFTVDGPGSTVIGNPISGAGALRKTGDGQLFLDDPGNSFTGGVTISLGTLGVPSLSDGGVAGCLGASTADPSNLVFDGGTLSLTGSASTSNRGFTITAGKTATIDVGNNSSLRLTGSVSATSGSLTKTGNGTLALAGNLAFTGPATVNAGTLILDGTLGPGTYPSDSMYAAAGATLGGSGTIGRDVYISGTHSPGSSGPSVQTINGAVIYNSGADVVWELVASTTAGRGLNYDAIDGNGQVAHFLGATALDLVFNAVGSTVKWSDVLWGENRQWVVYSNFFIDDFANFHLAPADWLDSDGALFNTALPGSAFSIAPFGDEIVLTYTGVPEPSIYALLALSAVLLGGALFVRERAGRRSRMMGRFFVSAMLPSKVSWASGKPFSSKPIPTAT